jgi:hypothetical protein
LYFKATNLNFNWRQYSPQSDRDEGPVPLNGDHTTDAAGSGYSYIQSVNNAPVNSTSSLETPVYAPATTNDGRCLEFYYFIQDTGSIILNVRGQQSIEGTSEKLNLLLWTRSVEHSGQWWKAEAQVNLFSSYTLLYEAVLVRNDSTTGLVAIDDVTLKTGACPIKGLCTFEQGDLCSWFNVKSDQPYFDWLLNTGPTRTPSTGPNTDHTLGSDTGKYIYMESSFPAERGWRAQLASGKSQSKSASCMSFYYFMYGQTMGTLNVYIVEEAGQNKNETKRVRCLSKY